jgi:hypothetical protein
LRRQGCHHFKRLGEEALGIRNSVPSQQTSGAQLIEPVLQLWSRGDLVRSGGEEGCPPAFDHFTFCSKINDRTGEFFYRGLQARTNPGGTEFVLELIKEDCRRVPACRHPTKQTVNRVALGIACIRQS